MKSIWRRIFGGGRDEPAATARLLPGIPGRVHPRDAMLYDESPESIEHYVRAASSAMENVEEGLQLAGRGFSDVRACLDFGCGHGRILRFLCQRIDPAKITACDVDAEAVEFCRQEFGARGLVSKPDVRELDLRPHDLIWVGSVLTHVRDPVCDQILEALGRHLDPGGLLIFSMHGELSYANLEHLYGGHYAGECELIRREIAEQGFSYRPYAESYSDYEPGHYGMSWHTREHVEEKLGRLFDGRFKLLAFRPQGWDYHHDVYIYLRSS